MATVGELFQPDPEGWGLRGDPYLWGELRRVFEAVPTPSEAAVLEKMIMGAIVALTGAAWDGEEDLVRVERYATGGMSSGMVSTEFWRQRVIPMLVSRYSAVQAEVTDPK